MDDFLEILKSHRSIRKFTDQQVDETLLNNILDSARQAPTSSNLQAYSIIVIRDPGKKKLLAEYCGNQAWVEQCPILLALCPDLHRLDEICRLRGYTMQDQYLEIFLVSVVDTSLVAQNIAVASEASGLGICMIGGIRNNPGKVCELLKLPNRVFPLMGMCLGYPDHEPMVKPRLPHDLVIHLEEYNGDLLTSLLADYDRVIKSTGLYEGAHRKIPAPDGRQIPDSEYSWTEHTARRAASNNPMTLRIHLREFLERKSISLG